MERNLNLESVDIGNLKIGKDGDKRDDEFVFMAKQGNSGSSLKTPTSMFGDSHDNKFKFSVKKEQNRMNKSRAKLKPSNSSPAQCWQGHDFILKAKMNVSVPPNVEKYHVTSNESLNKNDECEVVCTDKEEETSECNNICNDICDGEVETGSFKSGNDEGDITSDVTLESPKTETRSFEGNDSVSGFGFTFAASSSCPKRHTRKKNWVKVGHGPRDTYNSTTNIKVSNPNSLSSVTCSPFSGTSSLFTSGQGQKANVSAPHHNTKGDEVKSKVISTVTIAAEESCEKWRLRGNQAYKNGNLTVAEDCYTQGLNCVSKEEASQRCRRTLMLCYSNRAATRMSLGKMRDALQDCMLAAEIDPNFLRVQLRAANCCLALGELGDASKYFKRCLQSGTEVCVDQKIAVEASDLLQKTQNISELINHSDELLQRRTAADAERALEHMNEALMISSYSEKLLEMKAEALFMLRRYEVVIQLCDETLGSAEKNSYPMVADCKVTDMDSSQLSKGFYFRLWRCSMMLKSYFQLGKLEEGLSLLEAQEEKVSASAINKSGSKVLESQIPLAITVRELLHYKSAGNEAFQAGRHEEAIENYTAAISSNVESRPFAAVCFGNRAAAYKALGQITEAIADCNLAIALDGKYFKALSRRATLYEMIRDYDQAASDIRRVVSLLINEDNSNQHGISDRSIYYATDLKQNQIWLSEIEEEARKGIPLDMYLILGVEHSVSSSEIKKAYHKAALRHHPDKAGQSVARSDSGDDQIWKDIVEEVRKIADRLFKIIGEAYAVLSDPAKRAQYDSEEEMRNSQKKRHGNRTTRSNASGKRFGDHAVTHKDSEPGWPSRQ